MKAAASKAMRKFTDLFVERPVLSTVISLVILVLGLRSLGLLPVLQYPYTQNAVVTVSTAYPGADASLVASFITTPLPDMSETSRSAEAPPMSTATLPNSKSFRLIAHVRPAPAALYFVAPQARGPARHRWTLHPCKAPRHRPGRCQQ